MREGSVRWVRLEGEVGVRFLEGMEWKGVAYYCPFDVAAGVSFNPGRISIPQRHDLPKEH